MNFKFLPLVVITVFAGITTHAQDLTSKIPSHSKFVATINSKAIVEHSSMELINETLVKLGAFKHASTNKDYPLNSLTALDINLDKQSYIYNISNDSLYYVGFLLPLKNNHQVKEHMFSQFNVLPAFGEYERRVSKDGKTQVSWNQESLFIFSGGLHSGYFKNEVVAKRYGLALEEKPSPEEEIVVPDTAYAVEEAADAAVAVDEAVDAAVAADEAATAAAYAAAAANDTAVATDEAIEASEEAAAADSLYKLDQVRIAKNDSLKTSLFTKWIAADFIDYLSPEQNLAQNKVIKLTDQKHLIRFWTPNLDDLYKTYLPQNLFDMAGIQVKNLKYGYKDAYIDLIQDQHSLKLSSSVGLDPEMENFFQSIYHHKFNKKFKKYIPENLLAYAAVNISTEGNLRQLPKLISRWYSPMAGEYADLLDIFTTVLEIGLDEKAIGKVVKGDNVLFLTDLRKVYREYISYDYDDDYNKKSVTKTKEDYAPHFLWMFSSEDQRLLKKTLAFAIKKEKVTLQEGIYKIDASNQNDPVYILFKKDMVFVGSDQFQLRAIQENRFKTNTDTRVKKDIAAHPFNMVVRMSAMPQVIKQLEIPVTAEWEQIIQDLSRYGNLQLKSNKINKSRFYAELSVEMPKKDKNALQYLLKLIVQNLNTNDTN